MPGGRADVRRTAAAEQISCIPNVIRKEAFHLFHKGLSKEVLIEASKELIEEYRVVVKQ